jgi:hypothetical protein
MFLSMHMSPQRAASLASILGCPVSSYPQTYLGLPLSDQKFLTSALDFLAMRILRQIPSWQRSVIPIKGSLPLPLRSYLRFPSMPYPYSPYRKARSRRWTILIRPCYRRLRRLAQGATTRFPRTSSADFTPRVVLGWQT